ncbi:unnamed protein product [Rotaria sordida]|uniref:RNA polymerase alpha subunit domain-containing protein n=1 Tax=Rotaria sordida TaxID=392033 RepID=A0A815WGQ6_9BILA|nr:unnamed protein product [Rotaria sordida]CAF1670777.1 unnamed protein product [Rotaria sordida]
MLTKMMSSQMYLTRLDVLKDLEKIWTNEKEVLAIYLATLRSSHHSIRHVHNNSISLFFFQNRSSLTNTLRGVTNEEKLNNLWVKMQITVNSIFDKLVTRHNVDELRQLILNEPDVHPGANFVELEDGTIRRLLPNNLSKRTAVAKL